MATPINMMFIIVILLMFFAHLETVSAIKISITPTKFKAEDYRNVTISCALDSANAAADEILLLKIAKKGEKAIVLIHPNNTITYVEGNENDFPATGMLDNSVLKSYLSVTIKDPVLEDSGTYTCAIYYVDATGVLVEDKSSEYLTVADSEIKRMKQAIQMLTQKVNKGELYIKGFMDKEKDYIRKVSEMEIKSNRQALQISNLLKKEVQYTNKVTDIEYQSNIQSKKISNLLNKEEKYVSKVKELENKFNVQSLKLSNLITKETKLTNRISGIEESSGTQVTALGNLLKKAKQYTSQFADLQNETRSTSMLVSDLVNKETEFELNMKEMARILGQLSAKMETAGVKANPIIMFSATNENDFIKTKTGTDLVFPDVIAQEGKGYDPGTGEFTAPLNGLYAFHLVIKVDCKACYVRVQLRANNYLLVKLKVGSETEQNQGSVSAVAKLAAGDVVKPYVDYSTANTMLTVSRLSAFTGYLVNAGNKFIV